jgi:hypothetical protein
MNREVHVRFWERAGVKFLCATRHPEAGAKRRDQSERPETEKNETETVAPTREPAIGRAESESTRRQIGAAGRDRKPPGSLYASLEQELAGVLGPGTSGGSPQAASENTDEDCEEGRTPSES